MGTKTFYVIERPVMFSVSVALSVDSFMDVIIHPISRPMWFFALVVLLCSTTMAILESPMEAHAYIDMLRSKLKRPT